MKKLFTLLFFTLSTFSFAATEVDGTVTYKLSNGELASRAVTLDVPARGEGEVVLKGENFELKTNKFKSYNSKKGQTVFLAAFNVEHRGHKATVIFKGTYLKGSNEIIYYGSFYQKQGAHKGKISIRDFKYRGAFSFKYLR